MYERMEQGDDTEMNLVMLVVGILIGFLLGGMVMVILGLWSGMRREKMKKTNVRDLYPNGEEKTEG